MVRFETGSRDGSANVLTVWLCERIKKCGYTYYQMRQTAEEVWTLQHLEICQSAKEGEKDY